jgi:predicted SAM-dependent methyltransferase
MALFIFAADSVLRFVEGRAVIHTTASRLADCSLGPDQFDLIAWLCRFSKPTDIRDALASLAVTRQQAAKEIIVRLCKCGALVPAETPYQTHVSPDDDVVATMKRHTRFLSRAIYEVACDLSAFGPYADRQIAVHTGIGMERRLVALIAAVQALQGQLHELREEYLADQLKSLAFERTACELKLHIGCGRNYASGWINIDIHPAPLAMNALWNLPFSDGSARYVFVSHMLEHLFYPHDVHKFLANIYRVLAPGGVVRIIVPDIAQCIEAYATDNRTFFESRRKTWTWWPERRTRLEDFLAYAGAASEPAYLFEAHKFGYDFETLERALTDAGFKNIMRSDYMASTYEELRVDNVSLVANAEYGGRHYSLFVEAGKL